MDKKLVSCLLACSLVTSAVQAKAILSAETAPPNTTPGISIIGLAEAAATAGVADIQVTTGQTLTNSVLNVAQGSTDIAAAPFALPFMLSRAVGPYAKLGQKKGAALAANLAVLYTYRISVHTLYAYDSARISGWGGLKGKTIFNGPPRGAALTSARMLIKAVAGLDEGTGYKGLQVNLGQALTTIQDGSSDAVVLGMAFPDPRITAALSSGAMTIWSVPKAIFDSDAFSGLTKLPGSVRFSIPIEKMGFGEGVTIVSEDGVFRGPGTVGGDVVNVSMDFELAKALTAAFIASIERSYRAKAPYMASAGHGEIDPAITDMCGNNPIKYHHGAVAAWEAAGYVIPGCAK
ncbi:MAG: hypothetical protein R3E83_07870 [Burkholderiaceae bacterium]